MHVLYIISLIYRSKKRRSSSYSKKRRRSRSKSYSRSSSRSQSRSGSRSHCRSRSRPCFRGRFRSSPSRFCNSSNRFKRSSPRKFGSRSSSKSFHRFDWFKSKHRFNERDYTDESGKIDKNKLLEIATKNATKLAMVYLHFNFFTVFLFFLGRKIVKRSRAYWFNEK